jgi:NAD+ diphosphatase
MEYCYKCGNKLTERECNNCGINEGLVPYCENCKEYRFPFFNVAVSSVIYNADLSKVLLIQQYGRKNNILVAGYVNKEETLEHALIREIKEEVSLNIIDFLFNESRYFDKSNSLICNFICVADSEDFNLNSEVDCAKWYSAEEAKEVVLKDSLAEYFLNKSIEKTSIIKIKS